MAKNSTKYHACARHCKYQINVAIRVRPLQDNISTSAVQVDPSTGALRIHDKSYQFADHVICGSNQGICFYTTSSRLVS